MIATGKGIVMDKAGVITFAGPDIDWTKTGQNNCDQICQKGSYTHRVSRHTLHCHLLATSMHQQHNIYVFNTGEC